MKRLNRLIKQITGAILLAGMALCLAPFQGCRSENIEQEDFIVIGLLLPTLQEERWHRDSSAIINRAGEYGAAVKYLYAESNPDLQNMQMENLIAQEVDLIIVVACDNHKIAPMVDKAHEAGIKIIAYDRLIHNADIDMYISFQNETVGKIITEAILKRVPKGKIALIGGSPSDNNAVVLRDTALSILRPKIESGDIELVLDKYTMNWEPAIAYNNMKEYLTETNGDIDGVICANDGTASGVVRALEEFGLAGSVPVSGQDAELMACRRILQGSQVATVYKPIDDLARVAVDLAIVMAKGNIAPPKESFIQNGKKLVPTRYVPVIEVTRENLMDTVIKDGFHTYKEIFNY